MSEKWKRDYFITVTKVTLLGYTLQAVVKVRLCLELIRVDASQCIP